jgi:hypothetical protein
MTAHEKTEIVTVNFDGHFGFSRFFPVFWQRDLGGPESEMPQRRGSDSLTVGGHNRLCPALFAFLWGQ